MYKRFFELTSRVDSPPPAFRIANPGFLPVTQGQRYVAAAYATLRGDIEEAKVDRRQQAAMLVHLLEEGAAVVLVTKNINLLVASCRELRELCGLTPKVPHL